MRHQLPPPRLAREGWAPVDIPKGAQRRHLLVHKPAHTTRTRLLPALPQHHPGGLLGGFAPAPRTRLDGVAGDFPMTYEDLEPYFDLNDRITGVAGLVGDPAYPPKSPRQTPPIPLRALGETIARGFDTPAWHSRPSARATHPPAPAAPAHRRPALGSGVAPRRVGCASRHRRFPAGKRDQNATPPRCWARPPRESPVYRCCRDRPPCGSCSSRGVRWTGARPARTCRGHCP